MDKMKNRDDTMYRTGWHKNEELYNNGLELRQIKNSNKNIIQKDSIDSSKQTKSEHKLENSSMQSISPYRHKSKYQFVYQFPDKNVET